MECILKQHTSITYTLIRVFTNSAHFFASPLSPYVKCGGPNPPLLHSFATCFPKLIGKEGCTTTSFTMLANTLGTPKLCCNTKNGVGAFENLALRSSHAPSEEGFSTGVLSIHKGSRERHGLLVFPVKEGGRGMFCQILLGSPKVIIASIDLIAGLKCERSCSALWTTTAPWLIVLISLL